MDDNIDMYGVHQADMRKGLKLLIEADSEWQLKLRQLETQSPPEELQQYSFVLTNATDAAKDSGDTARETLQETEQAGYREKAQQGLVDAKRLAAKIDGLLHALLRIDDPDN